MALKSLSFKIKAIDATKKAFKSIGSGVKKIAGAIFSLKSALVGILSIGALGLITKQSLDATDNLAKMSRVLGISVKELAAFQLAAELGGMSLEGFAKASKAVSKNVFDFVIRGTGEAADAFNQLGISASDLRPIMNDQFAVMGLLSDRLKEMENGAIKTAVAVKLFGSRGADMLNALAGGSEFLKSVTREVELFGTALSDRAVRGVEEANDAMTRLSFFIRGVRDNLVSAFAPAITFVVDLIRNKFIGALDDSGLTVAAWSTQVVLSVVKMVREANVAIGIFVLNTSANFKKLSFLPQSVRDSFEKMAVGFTDGSLVVDKVLSDTIKTMQRWSLEAGKASNSVADSSGENSKKTSKAWLAGFGMIQAAGKTMTTTLEDSLANFFLTGKLGVKSFAKAMLAQFAKIMASKFIASLFGGGDASGFFGKIFGAAAGVTKVPGKASGGLVSAGIPIVVGEKGPEVMIPRNNGSIVPNNKLGGAPSITIVNENHFDTAVEKDMFASIAAASPFLQAQTEKSVALALSGVNF